MSTFIKPRDAVLGPSPGLGLKTIPGGNQMSGGPEKPGCPGEDAPLWPDPVNKALLTIAIPNSPGFFPLYKRPIPSKTFGFQGFRTGIFS